MNCVGVLLVPVYLTKIFKQPFLVLLSPSCNISLASTQWSLFFQANRWHQVPLYLSTNQPRPDYNMENCHLGLQCIGKKKKATTAKKNPAAVTKVTAPIPRSLPRAWHSAEKSTLKADKAHSRSQKPKRTRQRNVSSLAPGGRNRVEKVGHAPKVGRAHWKRTTGKRKGPGSLG